MIRIKALNEPLDVSNENSGLARREWCWALLARSYLLLVAADERFRMVIV